MHKTASSVCSLAPHAAPLAGEAARLGAMVSKSSHMHEVFGLVETLAERCAAIILDEFGVARVRLKLSKPGAVRGARAVGVVIEREKEKGSE